jgi:hypothetical protein
VAEEAMTDGKAPRTGRGSFIGSEVLLYVGALLLMLGLGTLDFDHKYHASSNTALGIALTILGVLALVLSLLARATGNGPQPPTVSRSDPSEWR